MRVPAATSGSLEVTCDPARTRWGCRSAKRLASRSRAAAARASSGLSASRWEGMRASTAPRAARSTDSTSGRASVTSSRPNRSQSWASAAWCSASIGWPWSLNQRAARRCSSGTRSGDSTDSR